MSWTRRMVLDAAFPLLLVGLFSFVLAHSAVAETTGYNSPPRIENVHTIIYAGQVYVQGYVYDADDNTTGWTVDVNGDISGEATVLADNSFSFKAPYFGSYGTATIRTQDPDGASSNTFFFEFVE